jgi:hypothetical protein
MMCRLQDDLKPILLRRMKEVRSCGFPVHLLTSVLHSDLLILRSFERRHVSSRGLYVRVSNEVMPAKVFHTANAGRGDAA